MLLMGQWHLCDDGIVRPIIRGEVQAADGAWKQASFLIDTAADRTAFSADFLGILQLQAAYSPQALSGVGGVAASVVVNTKIRFFREDGAEALFKGTFAAFTELDALDMSVLGRDISDLFALIVDRPRNCVCLVGQQHDYVIVRK